MTDDEKQELDRADTMQVFKKEPTLMEMMQQLCDLIKALNIRVAELEIQLTKYRTSRPPANYPYSTLTPTYTQPYWTVTNDNTNTMSYRH